MITASAIVVTAAALGLGFLCVLGMARAARGN